jgi:hypothetical protein
MKCTGKPTRLGVKYITIYVAHKLVVDIAVSEKMTADEIKQALLDAGVQPVYVNPPYQHYGPQWPW